MNTKKMRLQYLLMLAIGVGFGSVSLVGAEGDSGEIYKGPLTVDQIRHEVLAKEVWQKRYRNGLNDLTIGQLANMDEAWLKKEEARLDALAPAVDSMSFSERARLFGRDLRTGAGNQLGYLGAGIQNRFLPASWKGRLSDQAVGATALGLGALGLAAAGYGAKRWYDARKNAIKALSPAEKIAALRGENQKWEREIANFLSELRVLVIQIRENPRELLENILNRLQSIVDAFIAKFRYNS